MFSVELAMIMDRLYGGVCYAGIDTDPELKYPKGAGRVAFSNQQSYIAAISARFVQLQHGDIDKRVSVLILLVMKSRTPKRSYPIRNENCPPVVLEPYMKGTFFLLVWPVTANLVHIHTMHILYGIKLKRVG